MASQTDHGKACGEKRADRTNDDRNYQNGETNEFLCMLNNAAEKGIYVLAATNHPERIDKAVLRTGRIDELICSCAGQWLVWK